MTAVTRPRWVAVTPPNVSPDPNLVDVWWAAGLGEFAGAIWLRAPGLRVAQRPAPDSPLAPLIARARARGIPMVLGMDAGELDEGIEVVLTQGLAGVHLRGDPGGEPARLARSTLPRGALIGRSIHGLASEHHAYDYSCLAPVFSPRTPKSASEPDPRLGSLGPEPAAPPSTHGLAGLAKVAAHGDAWVVALGGIDGTRARACLAAGARGLAGIRSFFGEPDQVAQDVAALCHALHDARSHGPTAP